MRVRLGVFRILLLLLGGAALSAAPSETVAVAAAANLAFVLAPLNAEFAKDNPDVAVTDEIGASGSLVAQIDHGAPYDVFLSADLDYPKKLVAAGQGQASSLTTFAIGKLALWTTRPAVDVSSVEAVVRDPAVVKLAIANPKTAPYGRAAAEVLAKLGLTEEAKPKLVYGENISQTAQFVSTGNADAGLVALSFLLSPALKDKGRWLVVPAALYAPIAQGGILTKRGAANPAAKRYLDFLRGPEARRLFAQYGYGLP
jgi:molybdate transport system substrate-binding protein